MLRYIERNPVRVGLVSRAEDWPWSSLRWLGKSNGAAYVDLSPFLRQEGWVEFVNQTLTEPELEQVRHSVNRGTPFGSESWAKSITGSLGLEASLRPLGRPKREAKK